VARLTLRRRSNRGTGASQRVTYLSEDISPLINPEPCQNRNSPSTETRPRRLSGSVAGGW
jgi:hypothetical protein